MKISKSKQELARIISENGGWRDGAEFAWYGNQTKKGWFGISKPRYSPKQKSLQILRPHLAGSFPCRKPNNWHQTILSRAEYFHLYQAPDADGWIEWGGGEFPALDESGSARRRDGVKLSFGPRNACNWRHDESCPRNRQIVAYRLHKPEKALGELCGNVTEENRHEQVWTNPPTIEQLAADYRNAKDYADFKQQEADDAKADAEAKLEELIAAGSALGLALSVETEGSVITPVHPPIIPGDWSSWHQWEVGDFISWSIVGHTGEFRIIAVHHDPSRNIGDFEVEDKQGGVYRVYGNECRFIRRP